MQTHAEGGRVARCSSAALLLELLVGTASSAHPETRIVVKESIGFVEPLIIYGGLVTESGQRKSPTINAVLMPSNNFKPRRKNGLGWILLNTSANRKRANNCPGKESRISRMAR
jgi:hypothetical protein